MPEMHAPDERKVIAIDPPDPSWIAIRFAPFHYQAGFGSRRRVSGIFGAPRRLSEESIDAIVVNDVKDPCITACRVDRASHQFMLENSRYERSDGSPEHRHVDPFDVRRQLASNDGMIDPETAHLVEQIEAVWRKMETGFRHAHRDGYCRLLARAGSPHAPEFAEIPWDVFEHYRITDWGSGVAQSEAGDRLYALHVDAAGQKTKAHASRSKESQQPALPKPVKAVASLAQEQKKIRKALKGQRVRTRKIAKYFYYNQAKEPVGEIITKPLERILREALSRDGEEFKNEANIDARTARHGLRLARKLRAMNFSTKALKSEGFNKIR